VDECKPLTYGTVMRVRFNEILRGPIAMPFDEFHEFYAAAGAYTRPLFSST